ncbi:hypothetical protein L6452_38733 [Arctium lappa]|uniref:Uncharacterized protein n=1 Tax=Arctium lappa TaxID=4217 RepID=A0ACB8XPW1_ARCLA|nr:hypothetical protein L6452_38733 [Arctium lappa]
MTPVLDTTRVLAPSSMPTGFGSGLPALLGLGLVLPVPLGAIPGSTRSHSRFQGITGSLPISTKVTRVSPEHASLSPSSTNIRIPTLRRALAEETKADSSNKNHQQQIAASNNPIKELSVDTN